MWKVNIVKLKKTLKNLTCVLWDLEDNFYNFECRVIESEQYSRRENLIISGFSGISQSSCIGTESAERFYTRLVYLSLHMQHVSD